jgi:vitamin B12 transporter
MPLNPRTLACVLVLAFASPAFAQTTLHGRVLDPLGNPVAGATIHSARPFADATSGPDGTYTLPIACPCTLQLSAPTFPATTRLIPTSGLADLTLQTPTRTDQVTVTTGTPAPLAQSGAPITILTSASDFPHNLEIKQPLGLIPGVQITSSGQRGGATSLFLRGGESSFTKVLIDGVPVNDIGSLADLSTLGSVGISSIEVLRQPVSALYGSDNVSGVVSLSSARGTTPLPLITYSVDGGNLGTLNQQVTLAGARQRFDYATGFDAFQTANNTPNAEFHNSTVFANLGFAPDSRTDLRTHIRHIATNAGNPNAFLFYGVPDLTNQTYSETFLDGTAQQQTTPRLHSLVRFGFQSLDYFRIQYAPNGTPNATLGETLGNTVTISGANGYSVTGQAQLDYIGSAPYLNTFPNSSLSTTRRKFLYAESDYRFSHLLSALGSFQYESEQGVSAYSSGTRGNYSGTLQLSGDTAHNRLFYVLGTGIEANDIYGKALTPRISAAYYALRPNASHFLSGTKLHASFGKGVLEPSIGQQDSSLYAILTPANVARYNVAPLGAQYSRTYDVGLEQLFGDGRARVNLTFFHNQFTNVLEYVPSFGLIGLGVPAAVANDPNIYGAYVNSLAERSEGAEIESEFRLSRALFFRAGYTYLDARVQRSFSSDALSPTFNTAASFSSIPIGVYSPLVGARPFRRAPHTGYFALQYSHSRLNTQLTGTLVGRRDDSTFLGYADQNGDNSLLLPNRNLDGAYQRLALSADYRISARLTTYANLDNLLNQSYQEAFGYQALPITIRGGLKFNFGGESYRIK